MSGAMPATATEQRPPLLLMHGWMDVGASYQFTVDALARERYVIAPRLARLRPQRRHRRRQLLVPRLPGRPRCADRPPVARPAGGPVRPQHGWQPGHELCRRAPCARAPAHQPRRLRHAADEAASRAEAPGAVARRTQAAAIAAQLCQRGRGGRAADEDQPAARAPTRPRGWRRTGRAGATTVAGTSWAIRRTSASTRC